MLNILPPISRMVHVYVVVVVLAQMMWAGTVEGQQQQQQQQRVGTVSTVAGSGDSGFKNGNAGDARFQSPVSVSLSRDGSYALVADTDNNRIRKVVIATGAVTTFAGQENSGSTDASGGSAKFDKPRGIAISKDGKFALVADAENHLIRKIIIETRAVLTLAGSGESGDKNGKHARFKSPTAICISSDNKWALVVDLNHKVRQVFIVSVSETGKLSGDAGEVRAVAGTTQGFRDSGKDSRASKFDQPSGIVLTSQDAYALVSDYGNHKIRKVVCDSQCQTQGDIWKVETLAGSSRGFADKVAGDANFDGPRGLSVAINDNKQYVLIADQNNNRVRKMDLEGDNARAVTTLAGQQNDGDTDATEGAQAQFNKPADVAGAHASGCSSAASPPSPRAVHPKGTRRSQLACAKSTRALRDASGISGGSLDRHQNRLCGALHARDMSHRPTSSSGHFPP